MEEQTLLAQEGAAPGVTETAAGSQGDAAQKFEALIQGEMKEAFQAKVQSILQKRLKGAKETQEKLDTATKTLEAVSRHYGIDVTDGEALQRSFQENSRQSAQSIHETWLLQAAQLQELYPGFDLGKELESGKFRQLLKAGVDVQTAYEVCNKDSLLPEAMAAVARNVEENLIRKFRSARGRPGENGMGSQSSAITKPDVSMLTRRDRQEIIRRVQRGEKIIL